MIEFQISNPKILSAFDATDTTAEDALQTIFPLETEAAFLIWNDIYIPLSYKYDISIMLDDLIKILIFIQD